MTSADVLLIIAAGLSTVVIWLCVVIQGRIADKLARF
jgi:hypothetical protein